MKQLIIILLILLPGVQLFAQQEKSYVKQGNDLYQQKKYKDAETNYRKAVEKKNQNVEGNFNLGDALYKQKQFDKAGEQFTKMAETKNKTVAAGAYHNLGNTLLESKKLEESIEAYKRSLINNPKDDETRYNLAYAQEKLKQQQQQNKNNNKNKDNKNKDNKQNKDQKNKDQKNKDDKNKQNQDKKDQDKQNQDQQKKDQQQPDKISKDDAQIMLDALNNNEKQTQDKLKNKKLKGAKVQISKDW
jgi:Ca-activated chloride channel family protein